jgi:hypothetical protein
MVKKSRIIVTVATVIFTVSTVFAFSPKPAHAFFFWNPFEQMVGTMLTAMTTTMDNMMKTMLTLSDDIGTMADRILIMADKIGTMADRIVSTEHLMADLVRDVTNSKGPSSLVAAPVEGCTVNLNSPINITLSNGSDDYVLFMSNSADMAVATNVMVLNGDTVPATDRAINYATGNQLYIAVKPLNGDIMGPISNTVMINIIK